MVCLKVYPVRRKRIGGIKLKEFMENCEDSALYLLDIDSHRGREMNIKVYNTLSGIFEMWIDAAPRRTEDIMDLLILGASYAVISDFYMPELQIQKVLELTENVILKSYSLRNIEKFLSAGGERVITSRNIAAKLGASEVYVLTGREVCPWRS